MKASNALVQLPFNRCFAGTMEGAHAMIEGLLLASYRFEKYKKTDKKIERLKRVGIVLPSGLNSSRMKKIEMVATAFAEGTLMARDLVNTPSQDMCPKHMVEQAEKISSSSARLKLKVFNSAELKKMKCGGILSVAQGSEQEPYMVHLTYKPLKKTSKKIVLVGKGVTFDSGGLSLKPAGSMEDMKIDMSGAAAVLGVFSTLTKLMPSVEVHGIAALVENMPSGSAIRPGDIVDTMSGKTIEILNTDAEGRVTLADALFYGSKLKPDVMIDIATLTGAVMVALGQDVAGLMSNNKRLTDKLLQASKITGEMMWELPLVPEYAKQVKSKFADVKNITGNRYGGSITAGLFLSEFVGDTKWAHLDISGPAYAEKESLSYDTWGATGFPVRTLLRFIMKF